MAVKNWQCPLLPAPLEYRFEGRRLGKAARTWFTVTPEMRAAIFSSQNGLLPGTVSALKEDFQEWTGRSIAIECHEGEQNVFLASIGVSPMARAEVMEFVPQLPEAYAIYIGSENVELAARDARGFFWGWQTVSQLAALPCFPCGTLIDAPKLQLRALHLDLKGMMPKADVIATIIKNLSRFKINAILLEYEDKIHYEKHPKIAHPTLALSKSQYRNLIQLAHERGVQVIPKLQCIGHLDYILMHPKYRQLGESGGKLTYQLCPSHEESFPLWQELADELLELHGDDKYFHIGADEVGHDYECARCDEQDRFQLYVNHVRKAADYLAAQGKRVLAWDDVIRHHPLEEAEPLLERMIPVVWQYGPVNELFVNRLRRHGIPAFGASAVQASDAVSPNLMPVSGRVENMNQWAVIAGRGGLNGLIATAWTRMQCRTPSHHFLPTSAYATLFHAETSWRAAPVDTVDFDARFPRAFFGIDAPSLAEAPHLFNHDATAARVAIEAVQSQVKRNGNILELWRVMNRLEEDKEYIRACFSQNEELHPSYLRAVPEGTRRNFQDGVKIARERMRKTEAELRQVLAAYMEPDQIEEIIETRFLHLREANEAWGIIIDNAALL
jgi:hypothetical protein